LFIDEMTFSLLYATGSFIKDFRKEGLWLQEYVMLAVRRKI